MFVKRHNFVRKKNSTNKFSQVYTYYAKKDSLKKEIEEWLPKDKSYKTNFPLVKYHGCILPEDMPMSGVMEVCKL